MGNNQGHLLYFRQLGFIRFALALGVVLFHYSLPFAPFNHGLLSTLIQQSAFRVSFFFFISGFVMALVYPKTAAKGKENFWKRRLSRIGPMYLISFIITLFLVLVLKGAAPKGIALVSHFLMLQSIVPGYTLDLNYPTWSISVEVFFYLLFPFVNPWIYKKQMTWLVTMLIAIWLIQLVQHVYFVDHLYDGSKKMGEFIDAFPLWHFPTFLSGMITAHLVRGEAMKSFFEKFAHIILLLSACTLFSIVLYENPIRPYIHNGLLMPLYCLIVLSFYYGHTWVGKLISHPLMVKSGDLSFSIFLFQYPLWLVMHDSLDVVNTSAGFFLYLTLLILLSYIINKYLEQPLIHRFRKK
jgi:peptidoglycan/LPS O-acetylase OafA/YrhL